MIVRARKHTYVDGQGQEQKDRNPPTKAGWNTTDIMNTLLFLPEDSGSFQTHEAIHRTPFKLLSIINKSISISFTKEIPTEPKHLTIKLPLLPSDLRKSSKANYWP